MASIGISSATPSSATQGGAITRSAPAQAEIPAKASAVLQPDTVKLSAATQAKMMHRAGQSPALIAATLGTNLASVDGYLGITVAKQAATTPMPAATPQAPSAQPETGETASAAPKTAPQTTTGKG